MSRGFRSAVVLLAVIGVSAGTFSAGASASVGYPESHTETIDPGRSLEAVSCVPGTTTCVAADSGGEAFFTTSASVNSAATWSPWSGPSSDPTTALDCPTTSLCLLASGGGSARVDHATSLGGAFSTSFLPASDVSAISCTSSAFCLSAQEGDGFIRYSTNPTSITWTAEQIGSGAIRGASCLSASFCAAVDDSGHIHVAVSEEDIEEAGGGGWVSTDIDGDTGLWDVACISRSQCLAIDGSAEVLDLGITAGGATSVTRVPVAGASGLDAISCAGATCAVSAGGGGQVFASTDAGATWTLRYEGASAIDDISCASASLCAASSADGAVTTVNPASSVPPLAITTNSLPSGPAGLPYAAVVEAAGGEPPYRWSASGLPPGVSIDPLSGRISGTPRTAICANGVCPQPPGILSPTITVTDAGGTQASASLTIDLSGSEDPVMVSIGGDGSGEITSDPSGIACVPFGGSCEASFEYSSPVTLSAKPSPGSIFEGWAGSGCSGTAPCQVTWGQQITFVVGRFGKAQASPPAPPPPSAVEPPGTKIVAAKISAGGRATFRFGDVGDGDYFGCTLSGPGRHAVFKRCTSPRTYRHLRPGRYAFSVRASGPGGTDATPARRNFRIRG